MRDFYSRVIHLSIYRQALRSVRKSVRNSEPINETELLFVLQGPPPLPVSPLVFIPPLVVIGGLATLGLISLF